MEFLSIFFSSLGEVVPQALDLAFAAVALASTITALTPTPRDDQFVGRIYKLLELIALNVGHAKDRPANREGGRFVAN